MQVERAVLRDRAKTEYYIKYAQGKTMMQMNYRADALYKMICYDRYFTFWYKKHVRFMHYNLMKYRMKQRCLFNHYNKWLYLIDIYKKSRLKIARWLCKLYNSPMFRLRIKRKFAARRRTKRKPQRRDAK